MKTQVFQVKPKIMFQTNCNLGFRLEAHLQQVLDYKGNKSTQQRTLPHMVHAKLSRICIQSSIEAQKTQIITYNLLLSEQRTKK